MSKTKTKVKKARSTRSKTERKPKLQAKQSEEMLRAIEYAHMP